MPLRIRTVGKAVYVPLMYSLHGPSVILPTSIESSVELLRLPYVFSQTGLLSATQFSREAQLRGLRLDLDELQLFHRRRVLVPMFRIHDRPVDAHVGSVSGRQVPGVAWQLYRAAELRQLSDPATRQFSRWPSTHGPLGVYYSTYQLLALLGLPWVMSRMKARRSDDKVVWTLPKLTTADLDGFARDRALAVVLEALSARYRPRVMQSVSSPTDELWEFVSDDDPADESDFLLRVGDDLLVRQAEVLLSRSKSMDPLGDWRRVVRIGAPARWKGLRNDALQAQELRVAAELLLRFGEDQALHGRAAPLPEVSDSWWEPRHERLRISARERSETILDFRLSDRPALYLALEGQTEVVIASRLLEIAGFERFSTWVEVVDLEGVNGDLRQLARALAVPRVDPDGHVGARVAAPLCAVVVAADPEGKYATEAKRLESRDTMIDQVLSALPDALRTNAMRRDLEHLIFVRSWPSEFEFAHFSDAVLARAIKKVVPGAPAVQDLRTQLATCRSRGGTIKNIWKKWPIQPSKVALANELWPDLLRRVRSQRSRQPLPIVDLLEEVLRIAQEVRRVRELNVE